jgi:4-aminobutyrate aminotransferase-like enzyme
LSACHDEALRPTARLVASAEGVAALTSDVLARDSRHLVQGHQQIWGKSGLVIERDESATLWDDVGRRYLDLWAGGGVCSVGHGHPEFAEMVCGQFRNLIVGSHPSAARAAYVSDVAAVLPAPLSSIQLYASGAKAVEASIRLARSYTGRNMLSFESSFHSKALGALPLGDWGERHLYGPLAPGFLVAPYPVVGPPLRATARCCRVPGCRGQPGRRGRRAADRDNCRAGAGKGREPLPGAGFPAGSASACRPDRRATDLRRDHHGLRADRTALPERGADVIPDIMIIGKGVGNGLPVSGIVTTAEIGQALPFAGPSGSSSSYGGNPLSAAAAGATLQILQRASLAENARRVGTILRERLAEGLRDNRLVGRPGARA